MDVAVSMETSALFMIEVECLPTQYAFVCCRNKRTHERSIPACVSQLQFAINCGEVPVFDPQECCQTSDACSNVQIFRFLSLPSKMCI